MANDGQAESLRARQLVRTIRNNLGDDPAYFASLICELAHQAAEKLLRAYLRTRGIPAPKTQDLVSLWEKGMLGEGALRSIESEIRQLNHGFIEPSFDGGLFEAATEDDAMEAYNAIVTVQGFLVDQID